MLFEDEKKKQGMRTLVNLSNINDKEKPQSLASS